MLVIPAIDIRAGKCVRLVQGNFAKQTIYGDDPVAMAKKWQNEGAQMLHVVDLDGAKNGKAVNFEIIKKIVEAVDIPVQVGGGIRDEKTIKTLLSLKIKKVVLGTVALENKNKLKNLLKNFSSQISIALDTKNGLLVKKGWLENTSQNLVKTARSLEDLGVKQFIYTNVARDVKQFIYTNVARDGTLNQPDYEEIKVLLKNIKTPLIVGGGISQLSDVKKLKTMGVKGIIIGKALYEGKIKLREAINAG
ncbi:1-(5-phosphoribosyl)-5-[(5-phosphoribosylamino)methylideneamino] imidazole-4-carboxamide isomerase [Candidatus Microgenomates bacterium]|nr:1-(5-phosphoribosyl)-5-[(5-phosphoribosylamino)methylideneamino] imidazole-4-carboxamide isomerase [Candidatus Microgenomates bacterium]